MRFEYDNKLELTYAAERAEILSDLLLIGFDNSYTESLIGGGEAVGKAIGFAATAPFKAAGMGFRGAKNAVGLAKQGAERLRTEKNKLMNSAIMEQIKAAIGKFVEMVMNLTKSLINGESKLKKFIKDVDKVVPNRAPNQDLKPKNIKTITFKSLQDMGMADENRSVKNTDLNDYYKYYEQVTEKGSLREAMNFSSKENAEASLNEITRSLSDGKVNSYKEMKPDRFGQAIQQVYGLGGNTKGTKRAQKKNNREVMAQYFKSPPLNDLGQSNPDTFGYLGDVIMYIRNVAENFLKLNATVWLKEEEKKIKKAQSDLDKLNRSNIKGSDRINPTETVIDKAKNAASQAKASFQGDSPRDVTNTAESFNLFQMTQDIMAYGEQDDAPLDSPAGNTTEEKDANKAPRQRDINKATRDKVKDTDYGNTTGQDIEEMYAYIKEFFVNYAIAIHNTSNFYNATLVNLATAGNRALNDFVSITVDAH